MEKKQSNHLYNETSPYLLQHVHQPVNWYPWGEEAFKKAKEENKPIFLSIGYSTCHWCHVMGEESFDDDQVAALLNRYFVSIKVDKEERPDIDAIYMTVAQSLTGSGGWPLTILMTPEQKPFFAGTYFPKKSRYGRVGMLDLISAIGEKWQEDPEDLLATAKEIGEIFAKETTEKESQSPNKQVITAALKEISQRFDEKYGGFSPAPKFPTPHYLLFLLHSHQLGLSEKALPMAEKTLESLYQGGIYDHVGFGFSRYATDSKWLIPHFEKMLYDNALLVMAYTQGYQITKNPLYKEIAQNTLTYITREMTHPLGGFYSAQDADSQGEEGKYYTWTKEEIEKVLGKEEGESFCKEYGVTFEGNFEGKNIINLLHKPLGVLQQQTKNQLETLYQNRLSRYPLHKDDKILTAWNAMMISTFALAGQVFKEEGYIKIAQRAYGFIQEYMTQENGRLQVSFREGKAKGEGLLDDYAYMLLASLSLYEATFDPQYLEKGKNLFEKMKEGFIDERGGYYLSPVYGEKLLYRPKEFYDGATPSGNSILVYSLIKLATLLGNEELTEEGNALLDAYGPLMVKQPLAYTFALKALLLKVFPSKELVAVVKKEEIEEVKEILRKDFAPQLTTLVITPENQKNLEKLAPYTKEYGKNFEKPAFYLCEGETCHPPVERLEEGIGL